MHAFPGLRNLADNGGDAIRVAPGNADTYANRGLALLNPGFDDLSINDYNQAIELKPEGSEAHIGRTLAYTVLGRDVEAEEDLA